MILTINIIFKD